jgi:hypothetical protein
MYIIDRLRKASDYASMQPVERIASTTRKRDAIRDARRYAVSRTWVHWLSGIFVDAGPGPSSSTINSAGKKV